MSPRRSSRARTSQPNPSSQPQSNSSTSSVTSSRADGGGRMNHKATSPRSSIATQSLSSEEIESSTKPQPRRTRSSQDDNKGGVIARPDDEDDEEGEEEVTRCICGNLDYPGMPVLPGDGSRSGVKGASGPGLIGSPGTLPEDAGGLFIQCDVCKVWQHGGCVGIMEEAMSPEEYFCEQCRKELHKITTSINGQKYSRYLPVQDPPSSQSSPTPPAHEHPSKPSKERKSPRGNAEPQPGKRRATMNSRDSAYDEAEQLRRAIEESKREVAAAGVEVARKGKRSRSDSGQRKESTKRQRTSSNSPPSDSKTVVVNPPSDDEDENGQKPREGGQSKIRGAAARNHRNKELHSEPSPEPQDRKASKGLHTDAPPPLVATPTPPAPKPSHKKTGRPPTKRGRVGRNQYTKDRDPPHGPLANAEPNASPQSNGSGGGGGGDDGTPHINGTNSPSTHNRNGNDAGTKPKLKHLNPNRTSMNDMKRRVGIILDFISRTQVEMAKNDPMRGSQSTTTTPPESRSSKDSAGGLAQTLLEGQSLLEGLESDSFGKLSSVEMMEVLTRRLMRWQMEYGKWGDK